MHIHTHVYVHMYLSEIARNDLLQVKKQTFLASPFWLVKMEILRLQRGGIHEDVERCWMEEQCRLSEAGLGMGKELSQLAFDGNWGHGKELRCPTEILY